MNKIITVVIPCYKVSKQIKDVIHSIPEFIDTIIVVDDACPEYSGTLVEEMDIGIVQVIFHKKNKGVGGAVISGFKKALELQSDIIIKLDGDGQMNPNEITKLINPLLYDRADYVKGNRFNDFKALKRMPKIRLFGNSFLSFTIKLASGYWDIMDPTNGFCAISKHSLSKLNLNKIDNRYFFETDMLINLNLLNQVVEDVYISAIYSDETSNLNINRVILNFPMKILKGLVKRIFYKYYIYNFNMASIYFLISIPLLLFGLFFGGYRWIMGIMENTANNSGTIMLAALPIILGIQFLLQAISIDINSIPKKFKPLNKL
ncbi:glycosyltransferase family 2 protein [Algoriphagus sediminis]|uniref:Glycosyltransferase family 2 protein n=1 Tax=Algoriphagus sediminis TaxID=3057113 RepID=A0ABT7YG64_9BACT|nr:glycosyltransferase family 2 protein [Algoriphagus sediminis]MDN3205517.1 glycosyltransferase family 2 protein [Algoriphagus sediminis]